MVFIKYASVLVVGMLLIGSFPAFADDELRSIELKIEKAVDRYSEVCYGVEAADGGWGSAVLVSSDGQFLSSAHLFRSLGESVTLHQVNRPVVLAKVTRIDRDNDIALVQALDKGVIAGPWIPLKSDQADLSSVPVEALAFGHASGYRMGRLAPLRFGFAYQNERGGVVSTCRLTIGDSGGALLGLDGQLLGINRTIERNGSFATHVPISLVLRMWPEVHRDNS